MADIFGTSGNDILPGPGDPDTSGNDTISGLGGDDAIDGGAGDDALYGGDDNDTLLGGLGNDLLDGGDGDDILAGEAGSDQMIGGIGNDTMFAFGGDSADGGAGNDLLTVSDGLGSTYDGGSGTDTLTLDFSLAASGFSTNLSLLWIGLSGSIGSATVSGFESIGGTVVGSGFGDSITIGSNYTSAVTMNLGGGNDTGVGGSVGDTLNGGDGNDSLEGLDGNDLLTGGLGDDSLYGGNGNDTLNAADGIDTLDGGAGDDILVLGVTSGGSADGGIGNDQLSFDLAAAGAGVSISLDNPFGSIIGNVGGFSISGFEFFSLVFNQTTEHADTVTFGAAFDRAVTIRLLGGNDSYSGGLGGDYVDGGAGDDTLGGGGGTNTLIGGLGNDSYVVENNTTTLVEAAGLGTDTVLASLTWALAENFENLTLTGFGDINGIGNGAANVITGNNGANQIDAGGGNDTINGGSGNDLLNGMVGDDTLNGEGGNDTLFDGVGANTLNGGGGDDAVFFSGDAVNTADGGVGFDLLYISGASRTTGMVIDLTGMWTGGSGSVNGGTVTGFESLSGIDGTPWADVVNLGAGTTANAGINDAGAGNDVLTGTDGNNSINGGDGNDTIVTGAGTDEILGGAGDDTITIGISTAGTVDGGAGTDTLAFVQYEFGPTVALDIDFRLLWSGGTGTFNGIAVTGIELLETDFIVGTAPFFTSGDDSVVIGAGYTGNVNMELGVGADTASGGSGNDIIDGAQDNDVLRGGAGHDSLVGSYGSDIVYGDAGDDIIGGDTLDMEWAPGNDTLFGGAGNDTIEGGAYADSLYGGTGNDVLRGDSLPLDLADHGNDLLNGGAGDDQIYGHGGNDSLNGGLGADTLTGGLGNDYYVVDQAGDMVVELAGEGLDRVRADIDYVLPDNVENLDMRRFSEVGTGNALGNAIDGSSNADTISGLAGDDFLYGNGGFDTLLGGGGIDRLVGGIGRDTLTGGALADVFWFNDGDLGATRGTADRITDFNHGAGDKIRVRNMDADTTLASDQNFTFIGNAAFTGVAGQLHYVHDGGYTFVEGDTNGDAVADFFIRLDGLHNLVAGDFVL